MMLFDMPNGTTGIAMIENGPYEIPELPRRYDYYTPVNWNDFYEWGNAALDYLVMINK